MGLNGEEVLKLIDAGFTADEIRKMSETKEPSKSTDEPAPKGEESGEENTTPTGAISPDPINTDFMDSIKKTMDDINNKVKALQDANIKKAEEKKTEHLSAADVVTSFMENL